MDVYDEEDEDRVVYGVPEHYVGSFALPSKAQHTHSEEDDWRRWRHCESQSQEDMDVDTHTGKHRESFWMRGKRRLAASSDAERERERERETAQNLQSVLDIFSSLPRPAPPLNSTANTSAVDRAASASSALRPSVAVSPSRALPGFAVSRDPFQALCAAPASTHTAHTPHTPHTELSLHEREEEEEEEEDIRVNPRKTLDFGLSPQRERERERESTHTNAHAHIRTHVQRETQRERELVTRPAHWGSSAKKPRPLSHTHTASHTRTQARINTPTASATLRTPAHMHTHAHTHTMRNTMSVELPLPRSASKPGSNHVNSATTTTALSFRPPWLRTPSGSGGSHTHAHTAQRERATTPRRDEIFDESPSLNVHLGYTPHSAHTQPPALAHTPTHYNEQRLMFSPSHTHSHAPQPFHTTPAHNAPLSSSHTHITHSSHSKTARTGSLRWRLNKIARESERVESALSALSVLANTSHGTHTPHTLHDPRQRAKSQVVCVLCDGKEAEGGRERVCGRVRDLEAYWAVEVEIERRREREKVVSVRGKENERDREGERETLRESGREAEEAIDSLPAPLQTLPMFTGEEEECPEEKQGEKQRTERRRSKEFALVLIAKTNVVSQHTHERERLECAARLTLYDPLSLPSAAFLSASPAVSLSHNLPVRDALLRNRALSFVFFSSTCWETHDD